MLWELLCLPLLPLALPLFIVQQALIPLAGIGLTQVASLLSPLLHLG
ncbi:MAG TPA: hypothetical protein VED16_04870 [Candidatus Acidoferrum sp.]|nr:hypothetical protein [Candidatus Acidoferrum sp.]